MELFYEIKIPATIVHVVSVVFGMGAALLSDILFTFYAKDKSLNKTEVKTLEIFSSIVWYALIIIAFSGICLFLSDPAKYFASDKLLAKLTILAVLVVNGFMLSKRVWPRVASRGFFTAERQSGIRKLAFVGGAISVTSWLSVCILGVMDSSPVGYGALMAIYGAVLALAVSLAFAIEHHEFERR